MKNSRVYPFERNRYFYGKLLTVRDFESEQKYFNDKRRMLNRMLYGRGVIAGMQVVAVDDKSISVEMGVALDDLGREIVIASPVTLKLSMIDGFSNNEYAKDVYLCVEYDEKGKEPVHSIANSSVRTDEVSEYNRVVESYRLFIKEEAPDQSSFEYLNLLQSSHLIYQDAHVRVWQSAPRYVNPGDTFEVELKIEKSLQTSRVSFEYEVVSDSFTLLDGEINQRITFTELLNAQETEYEIKRWFRANDVAGKGTVAARAGSAVLTIGDKQVVVETDFENTIEIIGGSIRDKIVDDYFDRTFDQSVDSSTNQSIYLAKISLLQVGPTYMIEKIKQVPFDEYVYNTAMLFRLGALADRRVTHNALEQPEAPSSASESGTSFMDEKKKKDLEARLRFLQDRMDSEHMSTGVAEIRLTPTPKQSLIAFTRQEQTFFSEEIAHGMGPGQTLIVAGIEDQDQDVMSDVANRDQRVYFGDPDIFKDSPFEPGFQNNLSLGTVLYPKKGTFIIGVSARNVTEASTVRVRWWGYKKFSELAGLSEVASSLDGKENSPKE